MTTPTFQFAAPASGAWFTPAEKLGHLILVKAVTEVDPNHWDILKNDGKGGNVTKVTFDYVDLDDPAQNLIEGAANSHPGIAGKLTQYAGTPQMVLGRIGQAPSTNPARKPAFILEDATRDPQATARAGAWMTAYQQSQFAAPQPAAAPAPSQLPAQTVAAYQQAQTAYAGTPGPILPQNTPAADALPVVPGMTPETVRQLVDSGQDIAAIQAMAAILNPQTAQ